MAATVAVLAVGAIAWVVLGGEDETSDSTGPTTSSTTVPAGPQVEIGQGLRYTLPAGFTSAAVSAGMEISNGRLRFYTQSSPRQAGEDPLVIVQEYLNTFDALYPSVSFSQLIPTMVDPASEVATDGYTVYYRVMSADGSGFKGVVSATRRADGLTYLTDLFAPLNDASADVLPESVNTELYTSFVISPSLGPWVPLTPLSTTRATTSHPEYVVDGVVAISQPEDWSVEAPGPGQVAIVRLDGQRFMAARLADTADPLAAQALSIANLQAGLPDAVITPFTPSRVGAGVLSFDSTFAATWADGRPIVGVIRLWIDPERAQVFQALAFNFADMPPALGHEDFLMSALDISLTQPR